MARQPIGKGKQQLPTKWLAVIVVALIGYALVQPMANQRFGWNLPSAGSLLGQSQAPVDRDATASGASGDIATKPTVPARPEYTAGNSQAGSDSAEKSDSGASLAADNAAGGTLLHGLLRDLGNEVYESPAGLQYGPMSGPDKHRLTHVEKHLSDDPSRPIHGVFDGDLPQVLRWIDDGYSRGVAGDKSARRYPEGNRIKFEIRFDKQIGYTGGKAGKRDRFPPARNLRLVVEGKRVVTAFPFE